MDGGAWLTTFKVYLLSCLTLSADKTGAIDLCHVLRSVACTFGPQTTVVIIRVYWIQNDRSIAAML